MPVRRRPVTVLLLLLAFLSCTALATLAQEMHDHMHMAAGAATQSGSVWGSGGGLLETYTPRRVCMNYEPDVIWLSLISDALIALSYFSIPVALVYFVQKRKDLAYNWVFVAFAVFILACGTTHVFNVIAIWQPYYRLDAWIKALTALASVGTAVAVWPLIPKALLIPSATELSTANAELQRMKEGLEIRVQERTTDLELANAALREEIGARRTAEIAQARLAAIVESSSDAIIGITLEGKITDWNIGAQVMFGFSAEEIIGQSILTLVPPERHAEETEILQKIASRQRVEPYETMRLKKGGTPLHVSLTASPIMEPDGKIVGASKIARDITEKKKNEAEREHLLAAERAARADAEAASRVKDEFVATLSHELRTPLNAVVGWTSILRNPKTTMEEIREGLEVIDRNTRVQSQLIEDLLDMSRILSGKLRLDVRRVKLPEVMYAAIETAQPAAEAKGIRIQRVIDPLAPEVSGDPNRLQQVVWNLLSNAVKFTPKGGTVQVQLLRVNSHVEIVVSDTGMGIDPAFLPHVFERFRQGDSSTTRLHGGLGLGLAIVRHLVELHGGTVWAKSAGEGKGATFYVTLPVPVSHDDRRAEEVVHPVAEAAKATNDREPPMLTGLNILVLDDEPDARGLMKRLLEERGAVVRTAASAREAREELRRERPSIVISDIGMPEEDGYAFIRSLRGQEPAAGGDIPAIALTAFARAEDRRRALAAGFQMHVAKPVDPVELITVVASVSRIALK
ncbi:MAG: ATP-binding response regulator [Phycisphaerae bacterium]